MEAMRLMHYLNQFFAGVGSEAKADVPVYSHKGPLGPGKRLQDLLGDSANIVVTSYCGDNYFANHEDEALTSILQVAKEHNIRMLVAGPAFQAGRYGFACIEVCHSLSNSLGLDCVTAMNIENPGVGFYRQYKDRKVFLFPTMKEVRGMEDALSRMAKFVSKLATGSTVGSAAEEGYIPRGIRVNRVSSKSGAERAVEMLLNQHFGRPFETEIPVESLVAIPVPPAIADFAHAYLAIVCEAGVVPLGNPDGFKWAHNNQWRKYSIEKLNSMKEAKWEITHGGWHTAFMTENPNLGVPLDVCREMEREGVYARLYPYFYSTCGNAGSIPDMQCIGEEMVSSMKAEGVDAALLVAT